jgi:hypothetical protein
MQHRDLLIALIMLVVLMCIPAGSTLAAVQENAVIQKYFTLYKSQQGDPYTLLYPIELTRPGEITVDVNVTGLDPKPGNENYEPLRIVLVDARAFKNIQPSQWQQWINKANKFNPLEYIAGDKIRKWVRGVKRLFGKKEKKPSYYHGQMKCGKDRKGYTESIRHAVDQPELNKSGGRYVIIFRNIAPLKATGTIFISYPGQTSELDLEAEKLFECYPDLTVTNVSLNASKQLSVKVANRAGCGGVHIARWNQKGPDAITLLANVDGRNYGVTLPGADPAGKLRRPRSSMTYVFDKVKITKSAKVTVTVDASRKVMEANEANNAKTVQLGPPKATLIGMAPIAGKPDLTVRAIRLNNQHKVIIEVKNAGIAGLAPSLWNGGNQPSLNLKMNNNGWANISLSGLDPQKNLSRKGGVAVYNTGYVLNQPVQISATIDTTNVVAEGNENNNTLVRNIAP